MIDNLYLGPCAMQSFQNLLILCNMKHIIGNDKQASLADYFK